MNMYFVKNLETGRYVGDELEPLFEKSFWTDANEAREAAYARNVMYHKNILSRDKYVVEVKVMNCPIMYVKYGNKCLRRFFSVYDAIKFYEEETSSYEIGYEADGKENALDLTKDWVWTDKRVSCTKFDDSFWNSTGYCNFEESPGKHFRSYKGAEKYIIIDGQKYKFNYKGYCDDGPDFEIKEALKNNKTFMDENGIILTAKKTSTYRYYDFGGSYIDVECSFWYPNGRLFGYISLN